MLSSSLANQLSSDSTGRCTVIPARQQKVAIATGSKGGPRHGPATWLPTNGLLVCSQFSVRRGCKCALHKNLRHSAAVFRYTKPKKAAHTRRRFLPARNLRWRTPPEAADLRFRQEVGYPSASWLLAVCAGGAIHLRNLLVCIWSRRSKRHLRAGWSRLELEVVHASAGNQSDLPGGWTSQELAVNLTSRGAFVARVFVPSVAPPTRPKS